MSTAPLLLRQDDGRGLCTLTLNRPEAFNSLSEELLAALQAELDKGYARWEELESLRSS